MAILIDNTERVKSNSYTMTGIDIAYNQMYQYLYNQGILSTLVTKAWIKEERGKKSICDFEQVFYYQIAVDYILAFLAEKGKKCFSAADLKELTGTYEFKCVRNTILCKFGNPTIWDGLLQSVSVGSLDGLDNMVEEGLGNGCEPAWIISPIPIS